MRCPVARITVMLTITISEATTAGDRRRVYFRGISQTSRAMGAPVHTVTTQRSRRLRHRSVRVTAGAASRVMTSHGPDHSQGRPLVRDTVRSAGTDKLT